MITTPTVLYLPLFVPSFSRFKEWDDNHVIQFTNIISQLVMNQTVSIVYTTLNLQMLILGA